MYNIDECPEATEWINTVKNLIHDKPDTDTRIFCYHVLGILIEHMTTKGMKKLVGKTGPLGFLDWELSQYDKFMETMANGIYDDYNWNTPFPNYTLADIVHYRDLIATYEWRT